MAIRQTERIAGGETYSRRNRKAEANQFAFAENLQAEIPQPPVAKDTRRVARRYANVDAQAAGAPKSHLAEQELDEETQKFIAQSLTDVNLFASMG